MNCVNNKRTTFIPSRQSACGIKFGEVSILRHGKSKALPCINNKKQEPCLAQI